MIFPINWLIVALHHINGLFWAWQGNIAAKQHFIS
jgi:hypothetical protein